MGILYGVTITGALPGAASCATVRSRFGPSAPGLSVLSDTVRLGDWYEPFQVPLAILDMSVVYASVKVFHGR
jgi:hypothetical protein